MALEDITQLCRGAPHSKLRPHTSNWHSPRLIIPPCFSSSSPYPAFQTANFSSPPTRRGKYWSTEPRKVHHTRKEQPHLLISDASSSVLLPLCTPTPSPLSWHRCLALTRGLTPTGVLETVWLLFCSVTFSYSRRPFPSAQRSLVVPGTILLSAPFMV